MQKAQSVRRTPLIARSHGSETIRRTRHMLAWALIGLLLFALNTALAELARQGGYVTHVFARTLLWSIAPYLLSFVLLHRSLHFPAMEGNSLIGLAATLPFCGLL